MMREVNSRVLILVPYPSTMVPVELYNYVSMDDLFTVAMLCAVPVATRVHGGRKGNKALLIEGGRKETLTCRNAYAVHNVCIPIARIRTVGRKWEHPITQRTMLQQ